MDGEAMNKGELGVACRESIKEIQNTSCNSRFQETARSLEASLYCSARGRDRREFSAR